jgi:hypothetical protein
MARIYARRIPTEMIEFKSEWNIANTDIVRGAIREHALAGIMETSVAESISGSGPLNAAVRTPT